MELLAKQQKIKTRGSISRLEPGSTFQNLVSLQKVIKTIKDHILEELIKGIQDLRVEMIELKKSQIASSSKTIKGSKGFAERYMWCDNSNHKHEPLNRVTICKDCPCRKEATITFPRLRTIEDKS